ncbi:MAG: UDP-N-acetylmuramoyl-tripeptide--D-alanyl-D-alanine ligase [Gammaproteobacteria bacterium]|nr:UDP-N-acetylmuramoyl-tripeptide--D-alanyl-D-alanine ligase [Gammaproteobacteria bacterium]MBU1447385.1 UDP-N-acetylmuramoyl-tripeptide--D-alanyl-D-alanine ligase [Gammaproteobacteria bacterium]MDD2928970.1 UDP-N-acetylmuramoyl-tripeptide--D-alanyl-D-alanine ligase [Sideroxydans sp.]MDD5471732.1 UDP-N-acetylmuramoyl-tripeptide--D-alanyl-D-alanine ligase [Sideroxydans sp.]
MMMLSQVAQTLHARLEGSDVRFSAVSTDTRSIAQGDLFVALRGEHFDGARFVVQAAQAGAVAAIVNEGSVLEGMSCPVLLVPDTRLALGKLAAYWRRQFDIPLLAITGSNGKTTVKEMLAAILRQQAGEDAVLATRGNLNNDIGMPLTLLKLSAQHRYAVIEMGMNHPGEIEYLTHLAQPDVALINNASGAHLQGLGSVEGVARAKGEIFVGLKSNGTAVINADDAHAGLWRTLANKHRVFDFALEHTAAVKGEWQAQNFGGELRAFTPAGELRAVLQVPGEHNARNALAAATAALAVHVPLATIARALEGFGGVAGRLQRKQALGGATLIDDTYNANPASMHAALEVLAQAKGARIFVLGDMGELGDGAAQFHREIGIAARELGIESLYALGELSKQAVREFGEGAIHFTEIEELLAILKNELDAQTTVLVKGSRFMKMERVVQGCAAPQEETCCSH